MKNLINRFSNASLSMEGYNGSLGDPAQALNILNQIEALELALSQPQSQLQMSQCNQLIDLIKWISGGELNNYRTTSAIVYGSNIKRTSPAMIRNDLYYMFDNYNNFIPFCDDVDAIYLKESQLHISLLHIHPFEDGNGRVARIILIRNLLNQNKVPCVITSEDKKEYCEYIENNDVIGLAKFFQRLSERELQTILYLYNELNDKGLIKENLMTEEQQRKYEELIGEKDFISKNKKTVLRNINAIINIFRHGQAKNNDSLIVDKLFKHKIFTDLETNDYAMYCEETQILIIKKFGDPRMFMIREMNNKICFIIDNKEMYMEEFEYELNENAEINNRKNQFKKTL